MHEAYASLKHLGFSPLMIDCYVHLLEGECSTRIELQIACKCSQRGVTYAVSKLEQLGFIYGYGFPKVYIAEPLWRALASYHAKQRVLLADLLRYQEEKSQLITT